MAQTYSREDYEKIKLNLPQIIEAREGMAKGKETCFEIAKESGAPEYIKSAEAMQSGIEKLIKAIDEAVESTEKVVEKYRKMDEAGLLA